MLGVDLHKARKLTFAVGKPPVPREHGAWVMLLAPIALGFGAAGDRTWTDWLLLPAAASCLFCAREAGGLVLRRRATAATAFWLGAYLLFALALLAPLIRRGDGVLICIGTLAAGLLAIYSALRVLPSHKWFDRSRSGELLGVLSLTLTGAGAAGLALDKLTNLAWLVWAASAVYFAGGVLHVRMWLGATHYRKDFNRRSALAVAWPSLTLHLAMMVAAGSLLLMHWRASPWLLVAIAPAVVRAVGGYLKLSATLPPMKRVGVTETCLAIWYFAWMIGALRT